MLKLLANVNQIGKRVGWSRRVAKLCSESRAQQSMACFAREFGNWGTAFRRFSDWRKANVFVKLFDACTDEPAMEYIMEDGAIIMVQSHGEGTGKVLRARPSPLDALEPAFYQLERHGSVGNKAKFASFRCVTLT